MNKYRLSSQAGLSIIELLIGLALGMLLTAGIIQLFVGTKATYNSQDGLSKVQEAGRFAFEFIRPDVRMAGLNSLCADFGEVRLENHLDADDDSLLYSTVGSVVGWEAAGTGVDDDYTISTSATPVGASQDDWESGTSGLTLPDEFENLVLPGTDVLLVKRVQVLPDITAAGTTNANSGSIVLSTRSGKPVPSSGAGGVGRGDIVMVTDCIENADTFQNSSSNSNSVQRSAATGREPGNVTPGGRTWSTVYDGSMQIALVANALYYIGFRDSNGDCVPDADATPSLFRWNIGAGDCGDAQELVENVDSMQVLYGVIANGRLLDDDYVTADQVANWDNVWAVRVDILTSSPVDTDTQAVQQTFSLGGANVSTPSDRRIRQAFGTTIALRNIVEVR